MMVMIMVIDVVIFGRILLWCQIIEILSLLAIQKERTSRQTSKRRTTAGRGTGICPTLSNE
jgi:hypothetical protein